MLGSCCTSDMPHALSRTLLVDMLFHTVMYTLVVTSHLLIARSYLAPLSN